MTVQSFRFIRLPLVAGLAFLASLLLAQPSAAAGTPEIDPFVGEYAGQATYVNGGAENKRDLSVVISRNKEGFTVQWTSITYRPDGRVKEKSYEINFVRSDRDNVYAAAQKKNVFGHSVQMDPMKGEPYVWARIVDDTLTVYSLFVGEDGSYDLQEFDRSLAEGGLDLAFRSLHNGEIQREIKAFLTRM